MDGYKQIKKAAEAVEKACGRAEIAVVLGSGLGDYAAQVKDAKEIAYKDIPGFPETTVKGHAGKFVLGTLAGKRAIVMCGRFHSYEGVGSLWEVLDKRPVFDLESFKFIFPAEYANFYLKRLPDLPDFCIVICSRTKLDPVLFFPKFR